MRGVIDRLEATDIASLVVFDDRVKTLAPAQAVGDRRALYAALAQVHAGGSTNLHGGWKAGADTLLPGAKEATLARVILLSDGKPTRGLTVKTDEIRAAVRDWNKRRRVTVHAIAFGKDADFKFLEGLALDTGGAFVSQ